MEKRWFECFFFFFFFKCNVFVDQEAWGQHAGAPGQFPGHAHSWAVHSGGDAAGRHTGLEPGHFLLRLRGRPGERGRKGRRKWVGGNGLWWYLHHILNHLPQKQLDKTNCYWCMSHISVTTSWVHQLEIHIAWILSSHFSFISIFIEYIKNIYTLYNFLMQGKFIYIAHFIHNGNSKCFT